MIESLRRLGIFRRDSRQSGSDASAIQLVVAEKFRLTSADLYIANSGTSVRFLTALAALGHGRFRLEGTGGCTSGRLPICSKVSPIWAST